jgi:hypothetical protein
MVTQDRSRRQGPAPPDPRDEGQVALHVRVRPELRTRARRAALELRVPMRVLVEEALESDLRRRGY